MSSYGYFPDRPQPTKPALDRPGANEGITIFLLFLSGSCTIACVLLEFPYALIGSALLMAAGLIGVWRSRSWSHATKTNSTILLSTLYLSLAVIAVIGAIAPEGSPAIGVLFRLALLGIVVGVPAGIGAWLALVVKTTRARMAAGTHTRVA